MRARVYLAGLGGGVLVTSVLYYPLYLYLPGTFVKDWPSAPGGLAIALTGVGVVLDGADPVTVRFQDWNQFLDQGGLAGFRTSHN